MKKIENGGVRTQVFLGRSLLEEMDKKRGLIPRSAFIRECIRKYIWGE